MCLQRRGHRSRRRPAPLRARHTRLGYTRRPSPIRRSRAGSPRRATSSTRSAARSKFGRLRCVSTFPSPARVAQGKRAMGKIQLLATAFDLGEGGLGASQISLEAPNEAEERSTPRRADHWVRTRLLRSAGSRGRRSRQRLPPSVDSGGMEITPQNRQHCRASTSVAARYQLRNCPRIASSDTSTKLGCSTEIATCGVVAPEGAKGRIQLQTLGSSPMSCRHRSNSAVASTLAWPVAAEARNPRSRRTATSRRSRLALVPAARCSPVRG